MITTTWYEDNGTAAGTPAKGASRTAVSAIEWKSVDDATTSKVNAAIRAGDNSFVKYNCVKFTGDFTSVSDVKFAHTSGTVVSGCSIFGKVSSTYNTPATAADSSLTDISTPQSVDDGMTVLLSPTGPEGANPTPSYNGACFTQYIVHQLRTTAATAAGGTGNVVFTVQYREN